MLAFLALASLALGKTDRWGCLGDGSGSYFVRMASIKDAPAIAALLEASVTGLAPKHYTTIQVDAWRSCLPTANGWRERLVQDRRTAWVACANNKSTREASVIGMMDFEELPSASAHHLDCAYVHPDFVRSGVASMLYDSLERHARCMSSCKRLFTEASEGAKPFFERNGFVTIERQDVVIGSATLWNYRMEKDLV